MSLYAWLLLNTLSVVNLQRVALPRIAQNDECLNSHLHLIKEYFKNTTIVRREDTTEAHYCVSGESPANLSNPLIDLDTVIALYRTLEYVNSYKYINPQGPVTHNGVLSINSYDVLPLFQIADIRRKYLRCPDSSPGFEDDVNKQMALMGQRNTDGRGNLLAYSLGGIPSVLNVIPMAINMYWHQHIETKYDDMLGIPHSYWRFHEYWIRRFLTSFYPQGRVGWKIAVQYKENVFVNPKKFRSYRPLSFSLQYTAYTNENDDNSVYYISKPLTFLNDNHYTCRSVRLCHYEEFNSQAAGASQCGVPELKKRKVGPTLHGGKSPSKHLVAFAYHVQDKTYFYVQNENLKYSIHELLPGGEMGEETDNGSWDGIYNYSFPFFINGSQYMYSHSNVIKGDGKKLTYLQVHKLLPFGKIGNIPHSLHEWVNHNLNCVPFTINGKQFFLGQRINFSYFISKMWPNGMFNGEHQSVIDSKAWTTRNIFFFCIINTKLMLFRYSPEKTDWYIQPLLPSGKIEPDPVYSGHWESGYDVAFTYTLNGIQYIYAHSSQSPYRRCIRELRPDGKMTEKLNGDEFEDGSYPIAFPFSINGRQYIYKQEKDTLQWKINELL